WSSDVCSSDLRCDIRRSVIICNSRYIETEEIAVPDHGFHFIDGFRSCPHAIAIEAEFIHRLKHLRMNEITLKSDVIVMTNEIRFSGDHLHKNILMAEGRINAEVDQRIHTSCFYRLAQVGVCSVLREGKVV